MGQAKARGTREERVQQAMERKSAELGERIRQAVKRKEMLAQLKADLEAKRKVDEAENPIPPATTSGTELVAGDRIVVGGRRSARTGRLASQILVFAALSMMSSQTLTTPKPGGFKPPKGF